jgi:hypothetical protein
MLFKAISTLGLVALSTQAHIHPHARRAAASETDYDYVVVGSGAGGGPLASRLAMAGFKVLLMEAGDDQGESDTYRVPAWQLNAQTDPKMAWDFYVQHYADWERQEQDTKVTWRQTNGELYTGQNPPEGAEPLGTLYPRSGTLGGCGSHNASTSRASLATTRGLLPTCGRTSKSSNATSTCQTALSDTDSMAGCTLP